MYRSMLYVPGSSRRFIEGASKRGADAILVDLEDSVVIDEKAKARAVLTESVEICSRDGADVWVRINRPLALAVKDLEAAVNAHAKGVLVTKSESADHIRLLSEALTDFERAASTPEPLRIIAMIESPAAVLRAEEIARADERVIGLLSGGEDLATEMECPPTAETLRFPKLMVHLAAKAAKKYVYGLLGTVADYGDLDLIRKMAAEARTYGFDGATCVHPTVVPFLNEAFQPSAQEIADAEAIVAAGREHDAKGVGAFVYKGKMIDIPVIERAKRLLARRRS